MIGGGNTGIGGIIFQPAQRRTAPRPHPGVHRICPLQPCLARGGTGAQIAADIACGHADAAQAGDHDMRKILTNATPFGKSLGCRGVNCGGLGIERHILEQRLTDCHGGLCRRHAGAQGGAGIAGQGGIGRHPHRSRQKMQGRGRAKFSMIVQGGGQSRQRQRKL